MPDASEQARREAAEKELERQRQEFTISPAGKAREAFDRGDAVFQYSIDVHQTKATVVALAGAYTTSKETNDPTDVLNSVCHERWELRVVDREVRGCAQARLGQLARPYPALQPTRPNPTPAARVSMSSTSAFSASTCAQPRRRALTMTTSPKSSWSRTASYSFVSCDSDSGGSPS